MTKDQMVRNLFKASKELLAYLEENDVCDNVADDGDGYIDEWTSDEFEQAQEALRAALKDIQNSLF